MKKKNILLGFIILFALTLVSWRGLQAPSRTVVNYHANYQGKTDVLQVSPGSGGYDWNVLSFDLGAYAGQRITIEVSMQVWLSAPGNILWQINNSGYPIIANSSSQLSAREWHTIRGSSTLTIEASKVLYLSSPTFGNNSVYFADLIITINGNVVNNPPEIDTSLTALHTKWPFPVGAMINPLDISEISPQRQLLRHFNVLVAGNFMKPDAVMPYPWTPNGAYRWVESDRFISYAEANNMKMRGHVLFWHNQIPDAFFRGSGRNGRVTIDEL
jgi:hypothetical protein